MRKGIKILVITGISVILAGSGMIAAAFAMGADFRPLYVGNSFSFSQFGENDWDSKESETFSQITSMDLSIDAAKVEIMENSSLKDEIRVYSKVGGKHNYKVWSEGTELNITCELKAFKHIANDWDFDTTQFLIEVPAGFQFEEVDFSVRAGECNVQNLNAEKLNFELSAGDAGFENCVVGMFNLETEAGSMEYSGQVNRELDANVAAGDIRMELAGKESDFNYKIENSVGDVEVGTRRFSGFATEQTIDNQAAKNMKLDCAAGSIRVEFQE